MKYVRDAHVWTRGGAICVYVPKKIARLMMNVKAGDVLEVFFDEDTKSLSYRKKSTDTPFESKNRVKPSYNTGTMRYELKPEAVPTKAG